MGKVPAGKLCGLSSVLGFYMVEENYFPQVVIWTPHKNKKFKHLNNNKKQLSSGSARL